MDSAKSLASGVTVVATGASSSFNVVPRTENFELGTSSMASLAMSANSERKKRGRPRKYKPDEPTGRVFSPVPLSSSAPPATGKSYVEVEEKKASLARPINSEKKHRNRVGMENLGEWVDCSTGSSFMPHAIAVNTGEDISAKIMEFSLHGPRTVCIISGSGTVSTVTLRHPSSSSGTLTYEGLFDILSLSGSCTPVEKQDSKFGRSGMMTISLSGADGRIIGGLIAGLTVAATPVKVFVASFLLSSPHVLKPKKQKMETAFRVDASVPNGGSSINLEKGSFNNIQGPTCSTSENPTNWVAAQIAERLSKSTTDINISLQG